ncbi:MAG TPA: hypothetical protein VEV64_01160 [Rhizomicrobium sp.]|jgi:hypothetical protein|nr:hypothetical protein [Rhizomicrobium sp.]
MRNIGLLGVCVLLLAGCEKEEAPPVESNAEYQRGYDMGHSAGVLEERAQLCSQVANFQAAMAASLRQADICPKAP